MNECFIVYIVGGFYFALLIEQGGELEDIAYYDLSLVVLIILIYIIIFIRAIEGMCNRSYISYFLSFIKFGVILILDVVMNCVMMC